MEDQISVPPRREHGGLLTTGTASITLDVESRGSTTLVQLWPWTWKCVSQRWKNQLKPAFKLPGKLPRIPTEGRTSCIRAASLGTKFLARRVQKKVPPQRGDFERATARGQ